MKRITFLLGILAIAVSPIYGMYGPSYYGSCEEYCFDIEVSALYWRTCSENRVYGFSGSGNNVETYQAVESENDWGVQARLSYFFTSCAFAAFEYTYLDNDTSDHADNVFTSYFFTETAFPASVNARVDTCYQRFRSLVGLSFFKSRCADFYGFGGVSWIYTKERDRVVATPAAAASQSLRQRMEFNGAGFELGFGWKYNFWCGLGIGGEFNGVAGIGHRCGKFMFTTDDPSFPEGTNIMPSTTICIPGFDVKLELFYELPLCYPIHLGIGYEHHQFFNILYGNRLFVTDVFESKDSQFKDYFDMGFGGLTISAGVKY